MTVQLARRARYLAGFGANCPGPWGSPAETIARALRELESAGVRVVAVSPFYETAAIGRARQAPYVNAVALLDTDLPAEALLRLFKRIERNGGRRGGRPWGPRTLDIDILDYRPCPALAGRRVRFRPGRRAAARSAASARASAALRAGAARRHRARLASSGAPRESADALLRRCLRLGQGAVLERLSLAHTRARTA